MTLDHHRIVRRCLDDRTVETRFSVFTGREEDIGTSTIRAGAKRRQKARIVRRCLDDRTVKTRFSVFTGREEDIGTSTIRVRTE